MRGMKICEFPQEMAGDDHILKMEASEGSEAAEELDAFIAHISGVLQGESLQATASLQATEEAMDMEAAMSDEQAHGAMGAAVHGQRQ